MSERFLRRVYLKALLEEQRSVRQQWLSEGLVLHVEENWPPVSRLNVEHRVRFAVSDFELSNEKLEGVARELIAEGLMTGCACGCRGDFAITAAGCESEEREEAPRPMP